MSSPKDEARAADSEAYLALPGAVLEAVVERLGTLVEADQKLEAFPHARA